MSEKGDFFSTMYELEAKHSAIYAKLAQMESNPEVRSVLKALSATETKHHGLWGEILALDNGTAPKTSTVSVSPFYTASRKIFGLAFTVKLIERMEIGTYTKFARLESRIRLSRSESTVFNKIKKDEDANERVLEAKIVGYGNLLNNIRDIIFGMNDGLVELLAFVVGIAAAVGAPLIVLLAGLIAALSGTLSMAAGAYLSTDYEQSVIVKTKKEGAKTTPSRSAFYVGIMYFIGTLFPLAPFILGFSGTVAILSSIIVTAIVLIVVSVIISVITDTSMVKRIVRTLILSLGIAGITIIIGTAARIFLHIPAV